MRSCRWRSTRVPGNGAALAVAPANHFSLVSIHRTLRGRYLLVIIIGLLLGGAGGWAGVAFRQAAV